MGSGRGDAATGRRRIEAVLVDLNGVLASWAPGRGHSAHEAVVDAVRRWRAEGLRTALVTNAVVGQGQGWRTGLPLDDLFDAVVDSSSAGLAKPDPRLFRHTLALLGDGEPIGPERALLLDDTPGNVAGAVRAGLHGLLVDDPAAAVAAADELLDELRDRPTP